MATRTHTRTCYACKGSGYCRICGRIPEHIEPVPEGEPPECRNCDDTGYCGACGGDGFVED